MREVIKNVRLFEGNSHGRGYRINCDVSERKQFCKLIKQFFIAVIKKESIINNVKNGKFMAMKIVL